VNLADKLAILADAAKYDASCASSGGAKRDSSKSGGIGSVTGAGICHSYAPDGRCISLLKILLTNFCIFDCAYCINRRTSNVPRARFTPQEVVALTLDFYKRNYIEGLFLSSGIIRDSDYTMEQLVQVARSLREEHAFRGYIHLKTIPDASPELLADAGRYADRLSINIELPTEHGLQQLAPEKKLPGIRRAMGDLRWRIDESDEARKQRKAAAMMPASGKKRAATPRFAPAGQSTQMIVGADGADDRAILDTSVNLYGNYRLRRVYYSAFSPIQDASSALPLQAPPLVREHRLYQADWLLRFYGFDADEIAPREAANDGEGGMLDLDIDPKLAWALRHPERFPVDVNKAPKELLLRVPGLGVRNVQRIVQLRRLGALRYDDLVRLRVPMRKAGPFLHLPDHRPRGLDDAPGKLRARVAPPPRQQALFA
jgi:putative DNA modification/repair radical SAM protein